MPGLALATGRTFQSLPIAARNPLENDDAFDLFSVMLPCLCRAKEPAPTILRLGDAGVVILFADNLSLDDMDMRVNTV